MYPIFHIDSFQDQKNLTRILRNNMRMTIDSTKICFFNYLFNLQIFFSPLISSFWDKIIPENSVTKTTIIL